MSADAKTPDVAALISELLRIESFLGGECDCSDIASLRSLVVPLRDARTALAAAEERVSLAERGRALWLMFAAHLATCGECSDFSWTGCTTGRALRQECHRSDPTGWFPYDRLDPDAASATAAEVPNV
jgi:hypothetical protein